MLNSVVVVGKVMSELKAKPREDGEKMLTFSLAHSRDSLNKKGERVVDYFDVVAWNGLADFIEENFVKGDEMMLQGRLQVKSFKMIDGVRYKNTEIVAEKAYFGRPAKETE